MREPGSPEPRPRLLTIGAVAIPEDRGGVFSFPFDIVRSAPGVAAGARRPGDLYLIAYPDGQPPGGPLLPFIGAGPRACLAEAFDDGALDYLSEPWNLEELAARAGRFAGSGTIPIPGHPAALSGSLLRGPDREERLSDAEAVVLRALIAARGGRVSRRALARHLWPFASADTRAVDQTVSRLRSRLRALGFEGAAPQIRSIRGFGYSLDL